MTGRQPDVSKCFIGYPAQVAVKDDDATSSDPVLRPFLALDAPYPAPAGNPVLRGRMVGLAASAVSRLPLVARVLYSNAGFSKLRKLEGLGLVEPRFDPGVVLQPAFPARLIGDQVDQDGEAEAVESDGEDDDLEVESRSSGSGPFYSIADFHAAYLSGRFTPTDVIEAILGEITTRSSPLRAAFIHVRPELAKAAAGESTARWKAGKPLGLLDGVPFAVKDEFDVTGYPRTVGTLLDFPGLDGASGKGSVVEKASSWCVAKLTDQGAIVVGISNMHEMGADTCNCNPHYGTPLNPYAPGKSFPGGSSGGSASAVASGIIPFALGADGGGSIRVPAGFCGVFGLKPSHGRISARPTQSVANTTGVASPIAASPVDLAHVYAAMAKWDSASGRSRFPASVPENRRRKKILLGVYPAWFNSADESVRDSCMAAVDRLVLTGRYEKVEISLPYLLTGASAHAITILNELLTSFDSFTKRYESAKHPAASGTIIKHHDKMPLETLLPITRQNLSAPTRLLMDVAAACPATDWLLAQRLRHVLMRHLAHLFRSSYEQSSTGNGMKSRRSPLIIVSPTTPSSRWTINPTDGDRGLSDGDTSVKMMRFVWLANFVGCPAISAPVGYVPLGSGVPGNLVGPVSLMGMAEWGNERDLLGFADDVDRLFVNRPGSNLTSGNHPNPGSAEGTDQATPVRMKPSLWFDVFAQADEVSKSTVDESASS